MWATRPHFASTMQSPRVHSLSFLGPALDGEVIVFQHDLRELELIFKFREECIAFGLAVHAGQVEFAAAGQHLLVDLATAGDPNGFIGFEMVEHPEVCEAVNTANFARSSAQDEGLPAGQRASDGFVGLAAHHENRAHGGLLEPFEIFRQMPGDVTLIADHPVFRHSGDRFEFFHGIREIKILSLSLAEGLDRDRSLDGWMRVVVDQFEVVDGEAVDRCHVGVEFHLWQWAWFAREL